MFAAGFLLFMNCREVTYESGYYTCGWPSTFYYAGPFQQNLSYSFGPFEPVVLLIDIIFSLIILAEIAFLCEALIRRSGLAFIVIAMIEIAVFGYMGTIALAILLSPFIGERHPK